MPEFVLASLLLFAGGGVVWLSVRVRQRRLARAGASDLVAAYGVGRGAALVLAFTTPDCVPCKTIQRPVLEDLERRFPGRLVVGEVDAAASRDLAGRFGILTVPSTVVICSDGRVRAINNGTATAERLAVQIGLSGDSTG